MVRGEDENTLALAFGFVTPDLRSKVGTPPSPPIFSKIVRGADENTLALAFGFVTPDLHSKVGTPPSAMFFQE